MFYVAKAFSTQPSKMCVTCCCLQISWISFPDSVPNKNWYHNMPRAINVLRFLPLAFITLVQPPTLKYKKNLTYGCKLRQGRVDDKNKHVSRPPFVCLGLVWMKPSCERHMPYPCTHFYFDIKFGDRLYSKEKRRAWPILFWI